MAYRKDQGRMARMAAFWSLAILALWGARSLNIQLSVMSEVLGTPLGADAEGKNGIFIPVLSIRLTPAFLISSIVAAASVFLIWRWLDKPKNADLLIDTESEMRKVTWPTFKDVVSSSLVVIFCVLFLLVFLAGADILIARVTKVLWFGWGT
jgi:preprotein translocase SecE subunit